MSDEIPPAQKARTIAHMNKDHRLSLRHILLTLPASQIDPPTPDNWASQAKAVTTTTTKDTAEHADDPIMEDIDLQGFTVRIPSSGTTHRVKFDPPLGSWGERRERLVAMAKESAAALGVVLEHEEEEKGGAGDVVVNEYMPPRIPYDAAVFFAVLFYYFTFILVRAGAFASEDTLAAQVVSAVRFPGGVDGFVWLVNTIFVPVVGIHVAETWWLERTRLRKFGANLLLRVQKGGLDQRETEEGFRSRVIELRDRSKMFPSQHSHVSLLTEAAATIPVDPAASPTTDTHNNDEGNNDVTTHDTIKHLLLSRAPRRWVVYEPMVLLPTGSFSAAPWPSLLAQVSQEQRDVLWTSILANLSPGVNASVNQLTHLAVNEGIPASVPAGGDDGDGGSKNGGAEGREKKHDQVERENYVRSPTNLKPLYGVFFTAQPPPSADTVPTAADFDTHLWVSTRQNSLVQTWCPLHTMFSRGNIKEKARLLAFHDHQHHNLTNNNRKTRQDTTGAGAATPRPKPSPLHGKWAIDLYAGIGYFTFSYARLGLRVLCWEVNPWSVEGLRRGASANGFGVRVVMPPPPDRDKEEEEDLGLGLDVSTMTEQIIVFLEDNRAAARRVRALRAKASGGGEKLEVVHVNCGLLPTSRPVWRDAWEMVLVRGGEDNKREEKEEGGEEERAWLHLHENVAQEEIEDRKAEVQRLVDEWGQEDGKRKRGKVEHVELVKTYAPGVWHCVFDVVVTREEGKR
ncbi:hypothetical protein VTJ49DRAFT_2838 [Mycothermus thermophilus]|uniref:tRNA(Phe) (4-demethylwyosine(37)-C(7)) aminocarboxypropyltransferase n=1 Tax=Humicola insolens TaxID=85995 RepID=A0ABR3V8Y1_HUMIN